MEIIILIFVAFCLGYGLGVLMNKSSQWSRYEDGRRDEREFLSHHLGIAGSNVVAGKSGYSGKTGSVSYKGIDTRTSNYDKTNTDEKEI